MKKAVIVAFVFGAIMPFFWMCLELFLFNAHDLKWLDYPIMITSPFWWLDWSYKGDLRIMPLNGALYAFIAFGIAQLARAARRLRARRE